ncbi:DNA circularization protein [Sodalis sp. RH24]|uniref:DNA circularization protein n=1 Tax=unclassified Sodalis (in: enterobacteria) TaxID=2636512 RepID=UPI0039B5434D
MSWIDNLMPASFRNVPFKVTDDDGTFGRRVQTHEYPNRDKPYTEDLGRSTRRFTVAAYLIGDDYMAQRDKLLEAIEQAGPGTLVHPFYGEMSVCIDGDIRVSHSGQDGRMCRVALQFVEAGELSFPTSGAATASKLISSCSVLDDCISSAFGKSFGMDGMPDFMQNGMLTNATAMLKSVNSAFKYVDSGVEAASRLLQGDLSVLLSPPSSGMDFVNSLQTMWRSARRLTGDTSDLTGSIKSLSGVSTGHDLAPRGVWKTDSKSTQTTTQQSNAVAQAIRTTALSEAAYTVTQLPQPRSSSANSNTTASQNNAPVINLTHPSVLAANDDTPTQAQPVSYDELTDIRDNLNYAIDQEQARTTDDQLFVALTRIRADVNADISARLAQTDKTTQRTPNEVLPAVVLAADWYDSAARETDITLRNNIHHPGFVPVAALRVPVR